MVRIFDSFCAVKHKEFSNVAKYRHLLTCLKDGTTSYVDGYDLHEKLSRDCTALKIQFRYKHHLCSESREHFEKLEEAGTVVFEIILRILKRLDDDALSRHVRDILEKKISTLNC